MNTQIALETENNLKYNVLCWKLHVAIASLLAVKLYPPIMAVKINSDILQGHSVDEAMVSSAYENCCSKDKMLFKNINRLAYLRYELLLLAEYNKKVSIAAETLNAIINVLNIIPVSYREYDQCEIGLRKILHALLPNELAIAKVNLVSKALHVVKGELSNHVFNLVKLGRTCEDPDERCYIEQLIANQLFLLEQLPLTERRYPGITYHNRDTDIKTKTMALEKKLLKVIHWSPATLPDVKKLLDESQQFIALLAEV